MFSGDVHAQGAIEIQTSGDMSLKESPVTSILVGPVGTSDATWPSSARSIGAATPEWLDVRSLVDTKEINGFIMVNIDQTKATIRLHDCGGYDRSLNETGITQRVEELSLKA